MAYSLWYVNNKINEMSNNISSCDSGRDQLERIIANLSSLIDYANGISSSIRNAITVNDQPYKSQDFQAVITALENAKNNLSGVTSEISSKRTEYVNSRWYWQKEKKKLTSTE